MRRPFMWNRVNSLTHEHWKWQRSWYWETTVYFQWTNEGMEHAQDTSFPWSGLRKLPWVKRRGTRQNVIERQVALLGSIDLLWGYPEDWGQNWKNLASFSVENYSRRHLMPKETHAWILKDPFETRLPLYFCTEVRLSTPVSTSK